MSTAIGGANFVLHAAGWLEGGLSTGYEKLVQDADRLGAYQVMLSGLPIDDNAMARSAYSEVEPSGHFLGCSHTMANMKRHTMMPNYPTAKAWSNGKTRVAKTRQDVRTSAGTGC